VSNYLTFGAVLLSAALLNAANGLIQTFLPIRMTNEGFSATASGLMVTGHAIGFMIGCLSTLRTVRRIGHIRVFVAAASLMAVTSLAFAIGIDTVYWMLLRVATGYASAAMFTALESWLNAGTTRDIRGSVISVYVVTGKVALIMGQLILTLPFDPIAIFMLGSACYSLCLIPMATTRQPSPDVSTVRPISLREIYAIAPAGFAGCVVAGMVNNAVVNLTPVYVTQLQMPQDLAATVVSAMQVGTLLLQWPLGRLSDKIDRRHIILVIGIASIVISAAFLFTGKLPLWGLYALAALWGGFALSLYAVSIAHANDLAHRDQLLSLSAGLLMAWAIGAAIGPTMAATVMQFAGPNGLFGYSVAVYVALVVFIIWRLYVRRGAPADRGSFKDVPATTPIAAKIAHSETAKRA
jgi:MFS family permease